MAKFNVKLRSGEVVPMEAPDDWSTEQVQDAIHQHFPDESSNESKIPGTPFNSEAQPAGEEGDEGIPIPEATGLSGVGSDLLGAALSAKDFAQDIPEKADKASKNTIAHNAGQLAAGTADVGKSILNAPHDLLKYFLKKHLAIDIPIPGTKMHTSDLIPHIPEDTGVEKRLGLEADKSKGDDLLRAVPEIASLAAGGASMAKVIKKVATAPSKERLFKRALESKIAKAAEEKGLAVGDLDKLKDALTDEYTKLHPSRPGELTPIGQQAEINIKKQKLEANPKKNEIPEGELPGLPDKPDTKAMLEEHQEAIDDAKDAAETGVGILDNPSIQAGGKIKTAIENLKAKASGLYKAARNHYVDNKILADNSKEIKAVTSDLEALKAADELAPGYGSGTTQQKTLESHLQALSTEQVNASDIFDLQRTLEQMAENARSKQYASGKGTTDLERKHYGELAERLDNHAANLATRLESVGGKDVQKIISEANKGWKTYKQLTKDNPVGKAAMKGSVPNRALIALAEQHPANDFLKVLVDSDAELRKQLLAAYTGEKNINKLLKPSKVIKNYVESLPEVEEKLNAFKNAVSEYKEGEKSAVKMDKAHDDLVKSMKQVAEAKQLQQQIKFHEDAIPKIKKKMNRVNATSNEHAKLSKELKDHEKHLADKNHLLKKYGAGVIGFLGMNEIAKKFGI